MTGHPFVEFVEALWTMFLDRFEAHPRAARLGGAAGVIVGAVLFGALAHVGLVSESGVWAGLVVSTAFLFAIDVGVAVRRGRR